MKFQPIAVKFFVRGSEHAIHIHSFLNERTQQLTPCGIQWLPCRLTAVGPESGGALDAHTLQ
jgi:hypothetical protein